MPADRPIPPKTKFRWYQYSLRTLLIIAGGQGSLNLGGAAERGIGVFQDWELSCRHLSLQATALERGGRE
jgi:hypothetical protein